MLDTTAAPVSDSRQGGLARLWDRLPASVDRRIVVTAWLSFVAEVLIIATGGAVRLTGSGLGCSEWPLCTPDSLVPTPAQGIHGIIEFGNRTMTGVVGLLALALLIFVLRLRRQRPDLFALALLVVLGVIAQAIVGGITVRTGLNPFIVGFHYTASLLLVCVSAAFLVRMRTEPGPQALVVPVWFALATYLSGAALATTTFVGVLTTGSGPHSGDANVLREGFDATVLAHVHSWPGYILGGLVTGLTLMAWMLRLPPRRWLLVLLVALSVQIAVGIWQAREGLPEILVGIHMVLAALSAAAYTVVLLTLRGTPASAQKGSSGSIAIETNSNDR